MQKRTGRIHQCQVFVILPLLVFFVAAHAARTKAVLGGALGGWGLFNLVEGVIDHQIFGLHHVHPGTNQFAWGIGFLASGVALILAGFALAVPVLRVKPESSFPERRG